MLGREFRKSSRPKGPGTSKRKDDAVIIAEVSIFPLGTGTPSVSEYVSAAVRELEASGLKCTLGPMGTTVEAESTEEAYAAIARAQAAIFELGVRRAYTVIKMDERRDVEDRSTEDMMRSVRAQDRPMNLADAVRTGPSTVHRQPWMSYYVAFGC
jgi:uncharacterized protein (TIGR00106 family)